MHVAEASIIGAQLRKAQEAVYRGIKGTRWWRGCVGRRAGLEGPIIGWYSIART